MTAINKFFAFLSYILFIPGWLIVLIFRRKHPTELHHARQSLMINLSIFGFLVIWFVLTWLLIAIPIMGPLVAWFAFALVIVIYFYLAIIWLVGLLRAIRGNQKPLAIVGGWAQKLPF